MTKSHLPGLLVTYAFLVKVNNYKTVITITYYTLTFSLENIW